MNLTQVHPECQTNGDLAYHAVVHARADIAVFPVWGIVNGPTGLRCACNAAYECTSPGKHPRIPPAHGRDDPLRGRCKGGCGRYGHGLYDATTNIDVIGRWWAIDPGANIGQPAHRNGYAILDVDPKNGGDESFTKLHAYVLAKARVDLMDTLVQRTGSGGMHLLFREPQGGIKSAAKVFGPDMPGLDSRGIGGYTVTAPSLHVSGGQYEYIDWARDPAPWPRLLTDLMNPPRPVKPATPWHPGNTGRGYAEAALSKELDIIRNTTEGSRNTTLNVAAYNLGQLIGGGLIGEDIVRDELVAAGTAAGLGMPEAFKTVNSGLRSGMASPRRGGRAA